VPVVATRVGGLSEAVNEGVDGLLAQPEATALAEALDDAAARLAPLAAGVQPFRAEHSFDQYTRLVLAAIAETHK